MELYIYINNVARRVELFQDEKVSVTSSITNYSDLGKLFTDYSQSFTIPASSVNNSIFSHWYESAIEGGFDARIRYDGYIELDTIPFRKGTLKLTKANKKNGYVESYSVTFYGVLTQLKDRFKDDKLNVLDYSSVDHTWSYQVVSFKASGGSFPEDLMYPIIGHDRKYEYGTGTSNDVTINAGAINWKTLFPAIRVKKIMDFIQTYYGITFTGAFLSYKQYVNLFLLMKNQKLPNIFLRSALFTCQTKTTTPAEANFTNYNLTTNQLSTNFSASVNSTYFFHLSSNFEITTTPNLSTATDVYTINVFLNGILLMTKENCVGVNSLIFKSITRAWNTTSPVSTDLYTFSISTFTQLSFTHVIKETKVWRNQANTQSVNVVSTAQRTTAVAMVLTTFVKNYAPDMKVADFFMGIVKMFNLIITPINETTFELQPLELYYQSGKITDITKYVYTEEEEINAPTLNKALNFRYEKSENILNNKFSEYYSREYGDLIYNDPNISDGGTYEVKLPFENIMWEKLNAPNSAEDTKFQTACFLDKNLQPYVPKPVLMYIASDMNNTSRVAVSRSLSWITQSGGYQLILNYMRFTNENTTLATDINYLQTLNWGTEISSYYLQNATRGLYSRLYENYIANLYNLKTRVLKIKARLSKYEIANIQLKDRLIIRDKRYLINTMTFDLTTNETTFELITDYRTLGTNNVGYRFSNADNVYLDNADAVTFQIDLYLGVYKSIQITPKTTGWVQWAGGTFTEDTSIEISVLQNTTGVARNEIFDCKFNPSDGYVIIINQPA
jgi:hypothetical protein